MNRGLLLEKIVAQLDRHGPTWAPFLRLTIEARPMEFRAAVSELVATGRVVNDRGQLRLRP